MKRKFVLAGAVTAAGVLLSVSLTTGTGAFASADGSGVPWKQRPVTVGSGFRQMTFSDFTQPVVSASGRWVAFGTNSQLAADDTDRYFDTYLRDRWTDTTTRIRRGRTDSVVMSSDGHLIGGNSTTAVTGAPTPTWIYNARTGVGVDLPQVNNTEQRLVGINNDGYFLSEIGERSHGPLTTRAGRIMPNDTLAEMRPSAAGDSPIAAVTPALRHAVVLRTRKLADASSVVYPVRMDMATGEVVEPPADFIPAPDGVGTQTHRWLSPLDSVTSPDGRYVAMVWEDAYESNQGNDNWKRRWLGTVRLWDTVTNTWFTTPCCEDSFDVHVYGVLNDGRVLTTGQSDDGQGWAAVVLRDIRQPQGPSFILSKTFDGAAAEVIDSGSRNYANRGPSLIATDINRALFCTYSALSSFDTNNDTDCYLMPFPAAPPAT